MPSFPDSVFAPANRSNGQTIDASHMNGVQDEIVAIEGGYINGTARINSSNLNVTGTSTFASRPTMPPPNVAKVFLTSSGTLGSSAVSTLSFGGQDILTNSSIHSTATNPERLTPQSTGVYMVTAQIRLGGAPAAASRLVARIADSSGAYVAQLSWQGLVDLANIGCHGYKRFDALGGYVTCELANDAGGSTLSLSTGVAGTWFSLVKL